MWVEICLDCGFATFRLQFATGIAEAKNPFCGYLVVEAATADAAAKLFQDHPHITVFPGDGIDIMPFVT
jgi:hypothetical protein